MFEKKSISQPFQHFLQHGRKNSQEHPIQSESKIKKPDIWIFTKNLNIFWFKTKNSKIFEKINFSNISIFLQHGRENSQEQSTQFEKSIKKPDIGNFIFWKFETFFENFWYKSSISLSFAGKFHIKYALKPKQQVENQINSQFTSKSKTKTKKLLEKLKISQIF